MSTHNANKPIIYRVCVYAYIWRLEVWIFVSCFSDTDVVVVTPPSPMSHFEQQKKYRGWKFQSKKQHFNHLIDLKYIVTFGLSQIERKISKLGNCLYFFSLFLFLFFSSSFLSVSKVGQREKKKCGKNCGTSFKIFLTDISILKWTTDYQITLQNNVIDFVYVDKHRFTYVQFAFSNEFLARRKKNNNDNHKQQQQHQHSEANRRKKTSSSNNNTT